MGTINGTNGVVVDDVWRRSDLTPRDRILVTIVVLAAMGDDDQFDPCGRAASRTA